MVTCLVDTGSMVSTVTESFFLKHFAPWGTDRLQSCHWLQLRAANELAMPYIGHPELDAALCDSVSWLWHPGGARPSRCVIFCFWNLGDECHPPMLS